MFKRKPFAGLVYAVLAALSLSACSAPGWRPSSPAWKPSSPTRVPAIVASSPGRIQSLTLAPRAGSVKNPRRFPSAANLGGAVEATSGATAAAGADASSSATKEPDLSNDPIAAACLKCHGPFVELSKRTASYVTEWDEKANPHVLVPHDSAKIITCLDCHEAHPLPAKAGMAVKKADVKACYSCHHAETFAACSDCHNE